MRAPPLHQLFASLLALAALFARAAGTDVLANLRPGHPRLLLTDAELAANIAAAKTDPLRSALHARIIAVAEAQLKAPPLVHRLIGPRLLDQSRAAVRRVVTCAFAYRLTSDTRFAGRAKQDMLAAAAFPDWNPSHFLDVAEMGFAVAIGYDWLYTQLAPAERATLAQALVAHALAYAPSAYTPGGSSDKRLWFATRQNNWNQVCNGGLLAAALALADEEPALARIVLAGARASLPLAMAAYQPDGGYPEGPGYWGYGTNYNVIALALLESALGDDFGLGAAPAFDRTALYRLHVQGPADLGFNYADGAPTLSSAPAYTWLAQRYHHPVELAHSRALLAAAIERKTPDREADRFLALHAIWFPIDAPGLPAAAPPLDTHFRGLADIALFRSAWADPHALFVGFKAGDNSAHHAHLDLGSFVLEADSVRWALDLGPDDYNLPGYFDRATITSPRWSYYRLNNHSHNTLTPGGALQDPKAVAPLVAFQSTPARAFAVADLTAAYPDHLRSLRRGLALLDRARVLVQDEVRSLKPRTPLRWALVTGAKIALSADGHAATLTQGGKMLRAEILAPAAARFSLASAQPSKTGEKQNAGASMLAIDYTPAEPDTRLAVLLSPVGKKWPELPPLALPPLADWK